MQSLPKGGTAACIDRREEGACAMVCVQLVVGFLQHIEG